MNVSTPAPQPSSSNPAGVFTEPGMRDFLALPLRVANDAAEVSALELSAPVRLYICLHVYRMLSQAVVKGRDQSSLKRSLRGYATTIASRSASGNSECAMPRTSISTPLVKSATTGCMYCGIPSVVCRAIAVHTISISCCGILWWRRNAVRLTAILRRQSMSRNIAPM